MSHPDWNLESLGNGPLALALVTTEPPASATPGRPVVGAVYSGDQSFVLRPFHFAPFLIAHAAARLVCAGVGGWHQALDAHLRSVGEEPARQTLWEFARDHRLDDVLLLDQLVELALHGVDGRPKTLRELVSARCGIVPPPETTCTTPAGDVSPAMRDAVVATARAIYAVHAVLSADVSDVTEHLDDEEEATGSFGPLSLGVQVQGAVALEYARKSDKLRLRRDVGDRILDRCESAYLTASRRLHADAKARRCFRWEPGRASKRVCRDKDGRPADYADRLAGWLEELLAGNPGAGGVPFQPPRTAQGRVARSAIPWADTVHAHPLLQAWADLEAAANVVRVLARFEVGPDRRLRPAYHVLPRVQTVNPDLRCLRRLIPGPLFEAPPGRSFLVVTLRQLELRCLADHFAGGGQHSKLLELFEQGKDPVEYAAAACACSRAWADDGPFEEEFARLRAAEPDRHRGWLVVVETLLAAIVRCASDTQASELVREALGTTVEGIDLIRLHENLSRKGRRLVCR